MGLDGKDGFAASQRQMLKGRQVHVGELQSLAHWYPVAISDAPNTMWWRCLEGLRFTKPFFQDELYAQPAGERRVLQSPFSALAEFGEAGRAVAPTAFIFHISRCGSTLLTQMLAALPHSIVVSEPPVVDAFFRHYHVRQNLEDAQQLFRLLIAALGQRRTPAENSYFVKFDSWHVPWIPFVRQAFPHTPIVFLYREPAEVLASHQRQRGPQMIPGLLNTSRLRPKTEDLAAADLDAYCLRMLAPMLELAGQYAATENLTLVNYRQLPDALWTELLEPFGMQSSQNEIQAIQHRARFHSKAGQNQFAGDPTPRALHSGSHLHSESGTVHSLYEALEARRQKIRSGAYA
jgi:hypothetical protein